jgi:hypothetical protein
MLHCIARYVSIEWTAEQEEDMHPFREERRHVVGGGDGVGSDVRRHLLARKCDKRQGERGTEGNDQRREKGESRAGG